MNTPPPPAADGPAPARDPMFRRFMAVLCAVAAVTVLGGLLWRGLDFAAGALLGSLIVGLNLLWTRHFVRGALAAHRPRPHFLLSYGLKFAVSVVVLFVAMRQFHLDALGILAGVSTLLIAGLLVGAAGYGS